MKPMLLRDGLSLLQHALLAELDLGHRWVVAPAGLHGRLKEALQASISVNWLSDEGLGPGRALVKAAKHSNAGRLLVAAADHPFPSASLAQRLMGLGSSAWVVDDHGPQPMGPSIVDREALVRSQSASSVKGLLLAAAPNEVAAADLEPEERRSLIDVDDRSAIDRLGLGVPDGALLRGPAH